MKLVLQITAGILLALGVVWGSLEIVFAYQEYMLVQQLEERKLELKAQEAIRKHRAEQLVKNKMELRKQKMIEAEKKRKKNALLAKRSKAKHEAWLAFFSPREDCHTYKNDVHMVDCIEYRSSMRRKFNHLYDSGKLKPVLQ